MPARIKALRRRSTIHDVAGEAGVSIKTVSRVFNNEPNVRAELRERVLAAGKKLSYHPNVAARSLIGRRSFLIGLFFENPSPSYISGLQAGTLERLRGTRFRLLVFPVEKAADIRGAMAATAFSSGLDGLILAPPLSDDPVITAELEATGLPFVRIGATTDSAVAPRVIIDDKSAAFDLTDYLLRLGHRRIAIVVGDPSHPSAHRRLEGYRNALSATGVKPDPALEMQGEFTFVSGLEAGRKLLRGTNRPTAIFASNDDMAVGVLQAANELHISVPKELSIVGFDDTVLTTMSWPHLTTIRQPTFEMARLAADALIDEIEHGRSSRTITLDYELIIRASAGSLPKP